MTNYNDLNYSFAGHKRFFACTGIIIFCNEFTTRVLTSASLVRNSDDEAKFVDDLKVSGTASTNEFTGLFRHSWLISLALS
jgi:hypothetical protein